MSINWIKITDRAHEGIKIINTLPYSTFATVLNYVHRQMNSRQHGSDVDNKSSDIENELEELERLVGIERNAFLLMIKTFSYILRRISTFVIKPTKLQAELREKLQFDDEAKIDAIVRLWVRQTTEILNNLASDRYESNEVEDVAWKLNVEISSHSEQRLKNALAVLQLKTGAGEDINIEMNHDELFYLYNQFESIQNEIDSITRQRQQQQQLPSANTVKN